MKEKSDSMCFPLPKARLASLIFPRAEAPPQAQLASRQLSALAQPTRTNNIRVHQCKVDKPIKYSLESPDDNRSENCEKEVWTEEVRIQARAGHQMCLLRRLVLIRMVCRHQ